VAINGDGAPAEAGSFPLIVALLTLGVLPLPQCPVVETVEEVAGRLVHQHTWLFQAKAVDGLYETAKLREWWADPVWCLSHQSHPLARLRARTAGELLAKADRTEAWLREELKKSVPLMIVRKGERRVMIPVDATPDEEAFLLAKLDR